MTEVFLRSLGELEIEWTLVDRRFSASINAVGKFTPRKILSAFGLANRLIGALLSKRPRTVVFFCTTRSMSFVVDWFLSEILRLAGVKTVNYIHTQGYKGLAERNVLFSWMTRRLLTTASKTVCLSQSLYNDISPWVAQDSVWFIANTPRDVPGFPIVRSTNPRHITFLSNLISGKGIDVFLDIAIALASKYLDVVFDIVGAPSDNGQIPQLEKMVHDAGFADRFNFAGPVHGPEKWKYLQNSTLLIFPSQLVEAQPLTIIEAFASGTPVVAFGIGGIVDLIIDGKTGALVKVGSNQDMLRSIEGLLSAPELLESLGQCALDEFDRHFSADTYTKRWSEVLAS
ncbi:glycosyltransferase family 4 protein [Arthrobacter sp. KNU-44]|uniref:glycosyltransferase family 4 protein n=1 Tax=unclassified Arthrobacter TaxID=235627 RepID=UPI003F41D69B